MVSWQEKTHANCLRHASTPMEDGSDSGDGWGYARSFVGSREHESGVMVEKEFCMNRYEKRCGVNFGGKGTSGTLFFCVAVILMTLTLFASSTSAERMNRDRIPIGKHYK